MGWNEFQELLFRPRVGELLTNTSTLLLGTLAVTVVLGVVGGAGRGRATDLPFAAVLARAARARRWRCRRS